MSRGVLSNPVLKAKILAVLIKLADRDGNVDFSVGSISSLWGMDGMRSEFLYYLSEEGAISYCEIGDDGFAPIVVCSIDSRTFDHLIGFLAQIDSDVSLFDDRIRSLLSHDPKKLKEGIVQSELHIKQARVQLDANPILAPLKQPLDEIERHFESIRRVAENYDDVYRNILRPVQEEGRSGIKATVRWAVISIVISFLLTNYKDIHNLFAQISSR